LVEVKNFLYSSEYYPQTNFLNLELKERVNSACTFGNQKVEFEDVRFSTNLVRVDKRKRWEYQLQTYSKNFNLHERHNSTTWNRTEIFLSLYTIDDLIDFLVRLKLHCEGVVKLG
jgi:hypothetical protein